MLMRLLVGLSNVHRRLIGALLPVIGPRSAYALMAMFARRLYAWTGQLREQSEAVCRAALEADCRAALEADFRPAEIPRIAEQAFVHRVWNNVDLMLAPRLLNAGTYERYGGSIPEPWRTMLLDAQSRRRPVILVTGYYGPYDLLPLFLGLNGIRAAAVYRPHPNADFDQHRQGVRTRGGCEMVPLSDAISRVPQLLEAGRTVAVLADRPGGRSGVPVNLLGIRTTASRFVGLLAEQYGAYVAVAAIRREPRPFQFRIVVSDFFGPQDWAAQTDPVTYITMRYAAAFERIVRENPEQYLWLSRRDSMVDSDPTGALERGQEKGAIDASRPPDFSQARKSPGAAA